MYVACNAGCAKICKSRFWLHVLSGPQLQCTFPTPEIRACSFASVSQNALMRLAARCVFKQCGSFASSGHKRRPPAPGAACDSACDCSTPAPRSWRGLRAVSKACMHRGSCRTRLLLRSNRCSKGWHGVLQPAPCKTSAGWHVAHHVAHYAHMRACDIPHLHARIACTATSSRHNTSSLGPFIARSFPTRQAFMRPVPPLCFPVPYPAGAHAPCPPPPHPTLAMLAQRRLHAKLPNNPSALPASPTHAAQFRPLDRVAYTRTHQSPHDSACPNPQPLRPHVYTWKPKA